LISDFGAKIDRYLLDKANDDDRDYSFLHPSEFGGCLIQNWFKMMGEKPLVPKNATKTRLFDNGHYVHLRNQIYAKEAGVLAKDKIIKKYDIEEILIGTVNKNKIRIDGESGRTYYFSPGEIIWRVDDKNKKISNLYIGTDKSPNWDIIDNLEEGEEWWLIEVPVVDPVHHFGGHCDGIVINDGIETIIDYKGINDYSWPYIFFDKNKKYLTRYPDSYNSSCFICGKNMKKAKEFSDHLSSEHLDDILLDFKYKVQLHIYMMILDVNKSMLWYENKNSQIVIDHEVDRDEELIEKIKKNSLIFWKNVLSKEKPKRQPTYKRTTIPCSFCDYASQCWND